MSSESTNLHIAQTQGNGAKALTTTTVATHITMTAGAKLVLSCPMLVVKHTSGMEELVPADAMVLFVGQKSDDHT